MNEENGRVLGRYLMLFFNGRLNHAKTVSVVEADEETGTMKAYQRDEKGRIRARAGIVQYDTLTGTVEMILKPNAPESIARAYRSWREYGDFAHIEKKAPCRSIKRTFP